MTKGKPWTIEEETQLKALVEAKTPLGIVTEKFKRKPGAIGLSHPYGTHDDVFWSIALVVYATVELTPELYLTMIPR